MKTLTINNVTYKSHRAAWSDLAVDGVSYALARKRMSRGWHPVKAFLTFPIPPVDRRPSRGTVLFI